MRGLPQTHAAGSNEPTAVAAIMYWSVAPRRRGYSAGDRTQRSAGCRTNGSARPTAGRSPDGRPRPCADQTPAERALARVIRVATAGKAQDQTHGNRARYNQSSCHLSNLQSAPMLREQARLWNGSGLRAPGRDRIGSRLSGDYSFQEDLTDARSKSSSLLDIDPVSPVLVSRSSQDKSQFLGELGYSKRFLQRLIIAMLPPARLGIAGYK